MILSIAVILLFIAYSTVILFCWQSWKKIPPFKIPDKVQNEKISVVIAARNEEKNIKALLDSLKQQTYPASDIIVCDDHSTDNTAFIVKQFTDVALLQLKDDSLNSYKKKAIETAVNNASGELIITTDADCITQTSWLQAIAAFKNKYHSVFIAAPVSFLPSETNNKLLYNFQVLDFLVLQGITGVSVHNKKLSMCNGANLAYEKWVFNDVNGFSDIDHIASGDDMLLMHKIRKKYPDKVHYIKSKEAIVYTQAATSWKDFFNQRIRWASKANKYDDKKIFWVLLLVYLFNFSFLILFMAGFRNYHYWLFAIALWIAKTIVEFPFVNSVAGFFGKKNLMKYFFVFQPLHILYTIIAGWLGQFGKYEWKGRRVK
ncbi:MAG: glycosyltransferase [Bacteroidota bacterium]